MNNIVFCIRSTGMTVLSYDQPFTIVIRI